MGADIRLSNSLHGSRSDHFDTDRFDFALFRYGKTKGGLNLRKPQTGGESPAFLFLYILGMPVVTSGNPGGVIGLFPTFFTWILGRPTIGPSPPASTRRLVSAPRTVRSGHREAEAKDWRDIRIKAGSSEAARGKPRRTPRVFVLDCVCVCVFSSGGGGNRFRFFGESGTLLGNPKFRFPSSWLETWLFKVRPIYKAPPRARHSGGKPQTR